MIDSWLMLASNRFLFILNPRSAEAFLWFKDRIVFKITESWTQPTSTGLAKFSKLLSLAIVVTHHNKSENPFQKMFARYFNMSVNKVTKKIMKRKRFFWKWAWKTLNLKTIEITKFLIKCEKIWISDDDIIFSCSRWVVYYLETNIH